MNFYDRKNELFKEIFHNTMILRKPITGIVSGYHQLSYILIAPDEENNAHAVEINGKINVSPKFIISPAMLQETFGDVFDPETFDKDLQGRFFSFSFGNTRKNFKVENEYFQVKNIEEKSEDYSKKVLDRLLMQENISTGLIVGPRFKYYPVSIDRFINEILEREFNV
jgi:hypothetical protein